MDIANLLSSDETLFRNDEVFNPDHVPDQFMHRDGELRELSMALKPAMRGARPSSVFVIGNPATGKTTSVRLVFSKLRAQTSKIIPVVINCHLNSSAFKIFSEIRKAVLGMPAPDTGVPITKVQDEIFNRLLRDGKTLVVCLDDINYLFASGIADDVLYSILRAHEAHPGVKTSVFAISTEEVLHKLDNRVRSIFSPVRIEFRPYSSQQVYEILNGRRDAGLYPGVLSDALLKRITAMTTDLRFGIELFKQSILVAESDASKKVLASHVEKAIGSMQIPEASDDKMVVLSLVRDIGPVESGKLFSEVKERRDMSYSSFYRMLRKLEAGNFIEIEQAASKRGTRGRTSIITAKT